MISDSILFLPIIFTLCSIIHLVACYKENDKVRSITKLMLCPLLLMIYLRLTDPKTHPTQQRDEFTMFGIMLGFLGDTLLLFDLKAFFLVGLVSFLLGHVLYMIAIYNFLGGIDQWKIFVMILITWMALFSYFFYQIYYKQMKKDMILPAYIYGMFVAAFNSISTYSLLYRPCLQSALFLICAFLFMVSDSTLAYHMFIKKIHKGQFILMVPYIMAETAITFGLGI